MFVVFFSFLCFNPKMIRLINQSFFCLLTKQSQHVNKDNKFQTGKCHCKETNIYVIALVSERYMVNSNKVFLRGIFRISTHNSCLLHLSPLNSLTL